MLSPLIIHNLALLCYLITFFIDFFLFSQHYTSMSISFKLDSESDFSARGSPEHSCLFATSDITTGSMGDDSAWDPDDEISCSSGYSTD